jgi:predicted RecA/RadA family phage recombinase
VNPEDLEIGKLVMVGEEEVVSLGSSNADSAVELYDTGVQRFREGGEELGYVFPVVA